MIVLELQILQKKSENSLKIKNIIMSIYKIKAYDSIM